MILCVSGKSVGLFMEVEMMQDWVIMPNKFKGWMEKIHYEYGVSVMNVYDDDDHNHWNLNI